MDQVRAITASPAWLMLLFWLWLIISANAELDRFKHETRREDGSINLLVVGDWGRNGAFNQSHVANQMGRIGEIIGIDFVISTGDNFYGSGLKNEHDPKFTESFTRIYTAKSLQRQWYSVLGNHDYRGNVIAQLSPALKKRDNRWLCWRSFVVDAGVAEIFFVDTTPFVLSYWDPNSSVKHDWRGIGSRKEYIQSLLKDLDLALNKSSATWKVVVGHHGIKSAGYHGDTAELLMHLLPVLQANDVDFYVNGHDHCLQHIEDTNSKLQFFTSGAGSKAWRGYTGGLKRPDLKFYYDGQGFMSVQLGHSDANLSFHDINGKVLHQWSSLKQLNSSLLAMDSDREKIHYKDVRMYTKGVEMV
ncbi:hypothetical protein Droror1_Dr00007240 [Drosera rotundifolia]